MTTRRSSRTSRATLLSHCVATHGSSGTRFRLRTRRASTTTVLSRACAERQVSERAGDVIVLTSCTATKVAENGNGPRTAESLYAGQQHVRLMEGVRTYRNAGQPAGR